jgi:hypothetical protein
LKSWPCASFFYLSLITSCSLGSSFNKLFEEKDKAPEIKMGSYKKYEKNDYIEQLKKFEDYYINSSDIKTVELYSDEIKYILEKIISRISKNNELFFEDTKDVKVTIINTSKTFHFSLPGHRIFLSLGLLKKYLKNEGLLVAVLAYELARSEKNIYNKNVIVPTGYLSSERILTVTRINVENKVNIHKWAYYLMKRAGFDGNIYLTWIQTQNRNSIDFNLQLGDLRSISKEESLFKSFLIKYNKKTIYDFNKPKSSKMFYRFINRMNRVKYET